MKVKGIALAVSSKALANGDLYPSEMVKAVARNLNINRSGDIFLVPESYWFLDSDETIFLCVSHGSTWWHDTFVPIIFAGSRLPSKRISRLVHPVDIAATLAAYVGTKYPSATAGTPLKEILSGK